MEEAVRPTRGREETADPEATQEVRVPVIQEHVEVETRPVQLGEVQIRRAVEHVQETVSVDLVREDVRVEVREGERPLAENEVPAFEDVTIRVPVMGQEALVSKQPVVTGELLVGKQEGVERYEVTEDVRRTAVYVEEDTRVAGNPDPADRRPLAP